MRISDQPLPPRNKEKLLPLIPPLLFLVAILIPDVGNHLVDWELKRGGEPERAFRHLREGRNPSDALRIVPFLNHEEEYTRARAARDVSRLGDPRTVRPVFEAWHDGRISDRELRNAFNRYTGAYALPLLEEEFERLPEEMQWELREDLERLQARHTRWENPPRVDEAVDLHLAFLAEEGILVWEGDLR